MHTFRQSVHRLEPGFAASFRLVICLVNAGPSSVFFSNPLAQLNHFCTSERLIDLIGGSRCVRPVAMTFLTALYVYTIATPGSDLVADKSSSRSAGHRLSGFDILETEAVDNFIVFNEYRSKPGNFLFLNSFQTSPGSSVQNI